MRIGYSIRGTLDEPLTEAGLDFFRKASLERVSEWLGKLVGDGSLLEESYLARVIYSDTCRVN